MSQQVLSITQINEYIRTVIDRDGLLVNVAVRGEVSNYKVYPSGHHYFTLKDENASLKCVMFRTNAMRLRFKPENGAQVIGIGKISVYPRDGVYQLYCTDLVLDGVGDLYAAFEQLKIKLAAKGLFDPAHKKPLPKFPQIIGIVTSSAGAAIHDMLRIIHKRYPLCKVRLLPVRVQGIEAPDEIAAAIAYANAHKLADLLIVGRGGGSIEDLWAFNDEKVAYAIYNSKIPVISAVGHEPDVTISDFVADLRAATPSNAAELAVPDQAALLQTLDTMSTFVTNTLQRQLRTHKQRLELLKSSQILQNPKNYLQQRSNNLTLLQNRLLSAQMQNVNEYRQKYLSSATKLDAFSPLKVLTRGYAMVQTGEGNVIRSAKQTDTGDALQITFQDGTIKATVTSVEETEL